jgi:hypothetical protein
MGHEQKLEAAPTAEELLLHALRRRHEMGAKAVFTGATIIAYGLAFWVVLGIWLP